MPARIVNNVVREREVEVFVNNVSVIAYAGETIATALLAENVRAFYRTRKGVARSAFCNMGSCYECLVDVKARREQREFSRVKACMTPVSEGMCVRTGGQALG